MAEDTPSHTLDTEIPGLYLLELDSDLDPKDYANAALDVFHSNVAVKMLDDFSFRVITIGGTELVDDGNGDYRFSNRGDVAEKLEEVPFEKQPRTCLSCSGLILSSGCNLD